LQPADCAEGPKDATCSLWQKCKGLIVMEDMEGQLRRRKGKREAGRAVKREGKAKKAKDVFDGGAPGAAVCEDGRGEEKKRSCAFKYSHRSRMPSRSLWRALRRSSHR
jgi:hypothetical protein